ncbi:hypothetical protein BDR22DRAFT_498471 [Usnea florida]
MASLTGPTAPDHSANRHGQIISASVTLLVLPTVFVALRVMSRCISGAGFWWDDVTVVLGMILSWGLSIIMILASRYGLGYHIDALPPATLYADLVSFAQCLYAFDILYSLSMTCVKFSVVLFQYRIFPEASFRRILKLFAVFVIAFEIASILVFVLACVPVREFWVALLGYLRHKDGRCINIFKFWLANGSINTVTDFALLLLPLPLLWRLRANTTQKCLLTGVFISGLVVTAISMVRLVGIGRLHGLDVTYYLATTSIWTTAEPSIAIVCACLPSLRPLFVRIIAKNPYAEQDGSLDPSSRPTFRWRSGRKTDDRSFNRLPDSGNTKRGSWTNNVAVYGGKSAQGTGEESLELESPQEELETPMNRIRAKTTVVLTVSQRVDWQKDLF